MLYKQVFSLLFSTFLRGNWSIENDPELCLSNAEAEVAIIPAISISDTHTHPLTSEEASPAALLAGINAGQMLISLTVAAGSPVYAVFGTSAHFFFFLS